MDDKSERNFSVFNLDFLVNDEAQYSIHLDQGRFYKHRGLAEKAMEKFEIALELKDNSYLPMLEKTRCKLSELDIDGALQDAEKLVDTYPVSLVAQNLENDIIYEKSEYERSLVKFYQTKFHNKDTRIASQGIELVDYTINRSIGPQLGPCLLKLRKPIYKYHQAVLKKRVITKPMWKILREKKECDVVSVQSMHIADISPLRKERSLKKLSNRFSMYFNNATAKDLLYLKKLGTAKGLQLPQTPDSNNFMLDVIDDCQKRINICEIQLWSRQPIYSKRNINDVKRAEENESLQLHDIQQQTRRDVFNHLVQFKKLNTEGNLKELLSYV